jgi:thiamine-monophosphate kinase
MNESPAPQERPSEFDLIRWIRSRVPACAEVPIGIGDDAAALRLPPDTLAVVTTDMLIDGVHFRSAEASPRQVGHKAVARCVSDLAAMAADGLAVVIAMAAPPGLTTAYFQELFEGMKQAADEIGVRIIGGDIATGEMPLTLTITAIGCGVEGRLVRRSGARTGDVLMVTGELGGSLLGRHLSFLPRVREARWLREAVTLHAMIDISDGLAADANHIAEESGVGIEIWEEAVPVSADARAPAASSGGTPLEHALNDGEDYELLFTISSRDAEELLRRAELPVKLTCIGEVINGGGLWIRRKGEQHRPLAPKGWKHLL